jgi:hypothetical protein
MHPLTSTQDEKDHVFDLVLEQATGAGSFNITGHGIDPEFISKLDLYT